MSHGWYESRSAYPIPPTNTSATSPFLKGEIDVRWENPAILHGNEGWIIRGVNIYRSGDSDRGPYRRVNMTPVGGTFYRDRIDSWLVHEEPVTSEKWIALNNQAEDPYRIRTDYPIARIGNPSEASFSGKDVIVTIDGEQVPVVRVMGDLREVILLYTGRPLVKPLEIKTVSYPPTINDNSDVRITYVAFDPTFKLRVGTDKRDFYRIATVAEDPKTGELHETPLEYCQPFSDREIERVDYMWREGMRRNNWILDQGGERVKLFTKRVVGVPCICAAFNRETLIYAKQPDSLCSICFGTGIRGGYDGPYEIIIGPDEGDKRVSQDVRGRRKEHSYEVWIGPSPIVSQRDFIVKLNNDRYSIGGVRYPSNRGNILQQHFNIAYLDSNDIRYKFPIEGVPVNWQGNHYSYLPIRDTYSAREDALYPITPDMGYPMESERPDVPNALEQRGRTPTWENHHTSGKK